MNIKRSGFHPAAQIFTPVELAHKWAEAEHGEEWQQLSAAKQSIEIAAALDALNRAAQEHSE